MKKLILLVLLFTNIVCFAQYPQTNIIKALVFYQIDSDGYYYLTKDTIINSVDSIISYYGYDKKNKHLYVKTENSNCEITVTKDLAKSIKKSNIPKLRKDALLNEILKVNESLKNKYDYS
jgi:hypothetical protein